MSGFPLSDESGTLQERVDLDTRGVAAYLATRTCASSACIALKKLSAAAAGERRGAGTIGGSARSATCRAEATGYGWSCRCGASIAPDKQYMQAQLAGAGTLGPRAFGIDEISIRKGHSCRIVVSDLDLRRAIQGLGYKPRVRRHGSLRRQHGARLRSSPSGRPTNYALPQAGLDQPPRSLRSRDAFLVRRSNGLQEVTGVP